MKEVRAGKLPDARAMTRVAAVLIGIGVAQVAGRA
jgi:hypothetical protein